MRLLIKGATIVNEGKALKGSIVIEDDCISGILNENETPRGRFDDVVDATGCFVLPGIIDDHVHFREPGLTAKADIESESRAAIYGGVTTFFDMPNTVPQTTTLEALEQKFAAAARESHANYSFFFGATNTNADLFGLLDVHRIPGIKLFMGSSTGNMLVDREEALDKIFATAPVPVMAHCEDTGIINDNMRKAKELYGDDPDVIHHPEIRSEEACYRSTEQAVRLATRHGARLHVAHVTTARELSLFKPWTDTMRIAVVGTDHAPHLPADKQGGCCRAASGMPMIQFSLAAMLELVDGGVLTIERVVELMCHRPARLFDVRNRGFIRQGYKADLAVVRPESPWTVTEDCIQSKCGWSPMAGHTFNWRVEHTFCNGRHVLDNGRFDASYRGEEVSFR